MSESICYAVDYKYYHKDPKGILAKIGQEKAVKALEKMLFIRNFEQRGEQAYQTGKVWGFYHSYTGQEAIQTAAVLAGHSEKNLWATTYRCHALALLLGMTPEEGMCELYGKKNGNAGGRGGSMHLYTDNLFGGFGIVGGQWPIGAGLAFALKYQNKKESVAVCFGGEGSVVQGTFHETLNMAKLWKLPLVIVIENNHMGMGTQITRAIANLPVGENMAKAYGVKSYTVDGMDFFSMIALFQEVFEYVKKEHLPVIIEAVTHRFKGHSISDPANYRTKEDLQIILKRDPITRLSNFLMEEGVLTSEKFETMKNAQKEIVLAAMKFADESPFPDLGSLEEGVMV